MLHANDNADPTTFFSVCSGIEAATVAWTPLGWQCVGVSEIEKFPSAVLEHHYPDVKNHGDFTTVDVTTLPRVDVLCGGTPCQAFSVAGLRRSLDDARGNLTLSFVRLAHELADGNGLRNVVWENVPGVLSTKDNAFGCFLGALVGADDAVPPPAGRRWPDEGMVSGPKGRAAWAILDAQYFGLAQRRRRVLLVADFGNGADPAAVLFERVGMSGNPAPSREARKDIAPTISARTKGGGGLGTDFDLDGGVIEAPTVWSIMPQNSGKDYKARQVEVAQPLMAGGPTGGNQGGDCIQQAVAFAPDIARCVATREGSSQDYETTTMVVSVTGEIAHTLKAEGADASEDGTGRGTPIIAFSAKDYGADASADLSPTLRAGGFTGSHANGGVMPAIAFGWQNSSSQGLSDSEHISPTLDKSKTPAVAMTVAIRGRDGGSTAELGGEVATALRASQGGGDKPHVLTSGVPDTAGTMKACAQSGGFSNSADHAAAGYMVPVTTSAVRRLTPRECERLQGFQFLCSPDYPGAWLDEAGRWWSPDYTLIPQGNKLKGEAKEELAAYFERSGQYMKEVSDGQLEFDREAFEAAWPRLSADGPRYKALGNSWAVPKFTWLGRRIAMHMPKVAIDTKDAA